MMPIVAQHRIKMGHCNTTLKFASILCKFAKKNSKIAYFADSRGVKSQNGNKSLPYKTCLLN